jgi:RNA polymerase sigma-70 factor, ECF subfamily
MERDGRDDPAVEDSESRALWEFNSAYNRGMSAQPDKPSEDPSDPELMRRISSGDMGALAVMVGRHQDRVRRTAYRVLGRWDAADDVAQEVFLRLYKSAPRYIPLAAFGTWLHRIVVNLCLDALKRRRAQPLGERDWADEAAGVDALEQRERVAAVQRELAQLPERQRVAVVLHRFEGLEHRDIAAVTGWSESAVESLLVRAYARLRERLKNWA